MRDEAKQPQPSIWKRALNMQRAELQADCIWSCSALSSTRPVTCFLSDRLCVSNAKRWFKATHTLPSVDALWVNMSFSMRKSVSQTLFRPLKNVRLPPSQYHKSFSTSSIPKVNVMFYGVLERTRGMLSNTSALQESLENTKLNDITPSHTNVKVNIMYQLFLTFTSRARFKSAAVFCGDFGKSAEWIETQLKSLNRAENTTFILKLK